jgi:hypothetical protein
MPDLVLIFFFWQLPIDPETKKPSHEPDPAHPIHLFWDKILQLYLLPALPLIRGNAVCTVEVWNIIRQYETTAQWQLYGEWQSTIYKSHPELHICQVQADRAKAYSDISLTTPSIHYLGPLRNWRIQILASSPPMLSIRPWPMTIWPMSPFELCDMSPTWVSMSLFSSSWMHLLIQPKIE